MAKTSKDKGSKVHTRETLENAASQIERVLGELRGQIGALKLLGIDSLSIPLDSSRITGIKRLRAWADSVRDTVDEATEKPVSDSPAKPAKRQQNK